MSCTIESITDLAFGRYVATQKKALDAVAFLVFSCTDVEGGDMVAIELGRSQTGDFSPRQMIGPGSPVRYNLYSNAGRTRVWGDGSADTVDVRVRPQRGRSTSVAIYGRVPPAQRVTPGIYSDTIVVTLMF